MVLLEYKRCARCGRILHISHFNRNASMPDGRQMHCRVCGKIATAESRAKAEERRAIRNEAVALLNGDVPMNVVSVEAILKHIVEVL